MALISAGMEYMPEQLKEFPWKDRVYCWNYESCYGRQPGWARVTLWFLFDEQRVPAHAQSYFRQAYGDFLLVWEWCEARYELPFLPEFSMQGHTCLGPKATLPYRHLAALGTLVLGSMKPSATASPT